MNDEQKSKDQLILELHEFRTLLTELGKLEITHNQLLSKLTRSEEKYRLVVENANEAIVVIKSGKIMFFNQKALEISSFSKDEFMGRPFEKFVHPSDRKSAVSRHFERMEKKNVNGFNTFRIIDKNNRIKWVENHSALVCWEGESAIINFITDITERKIAEEALKESEAKYKTLFECANDAIFFISETNNIIDVNYRAIEMFGYSREELLNMKTADLYVQISEKHGSCTGLDLSSEEPIEMAARHRDGRQLDIEQTITPLISGRQTLFMSIIRNITERKQAEEKITFLALHDPLTGLPNRTSFFNRLNHAIDVSRKNQDMTALLYIDLDGFKPVNDTIGHKAGDQVLREVSKRLKENVGKSDTVARIGGDEFVAILTNIKVMADIEQAAEQIIASIGQPINVGEQNCTIGASIGISVYPENGKDPDALMQKADAAMYVVKEKGKNNYCFYMPDFD